MPCSISNRSYVVIRQQGKLQIDPIVPQILGGSSCAKNGVSNCRARLVIDALRHQDELSFEKIITNAFLGVKMLFEYD